MVPDPGVSILSTLLLSTVENLLMKGFLEPAWEKLVSPTITQTLENWHKQHPFLPDATLIHLREVYQTTVQEFESDLGPGASTIQYCLELRSEELLPWLVQVVIEYNPSELSSLPKELAKKLRIQQAKDTQLLAHFLTLFRKNLYASKLDQFRAAIQYAELRETSRVFKHIDQNMVTQTGSLEELVSMFRTFMAGQETALDESEAVLNCLLFIRQRWMNMRLPVIQQAQGIITNPPLKKMFVPLPLRLLKPDEPVNKSINEGFHQADAHHIQIADLLRLPSPCILLGLPGSGKSTLIGRIALDFADAHPGKLCESPQALFPIYLPLNQLGAYLSSMQNRYAEPCIGPMVDAIWDYYSNGWKIRLPRDFFLNRLQQGSCLVLLDGLDEVGKNSSLVVSYIRCFIQTFGRTAGNRIILTSRPGGYDPFRGYLGDCQLQEVLIEKLTSDRVKELVGNIISIIETDPILQKKSIQELHHGIQRSADIREIAANPLFCTALVQVYKYYGASLPERRVDVLETIVNLLLGYWRLQTSQVSGYLEPNEPSFSIGGVAALVTTKKMRLAYIAYIMQKNHKLYLEKPDITQKLTAFIQQEGQITNDWQGVANRFLVDAHLNSGLLVEPAPNKYIFLHKMFMEYLAATWLVEQNKVIAKAFAAAGDPWWESVLLLAAAHPSFNQRDRWSFINKVLKYAPNTTDAGRRTALLLLAGRAMIDMCTGYTAVQKENLREAIFLIQTGADAAPKDRVNAGTILGKLGDPRVSVNKVDEMQFCQVAAGPFWMGEKPKQKEMNLPGYWIGMYPVSWAQYNAFVQEDGYLDERWWKHILTQRWVKGQGYIETPDSPARQHPRYPHEVPGLDNHPVTGVSWDEAFAFTLWLNHRWRGWLPNGWQVNLPDEAAWEKAARGGLQVNRPVIGSPKEFYTMASQFQSPLVLETNPDPTRRYPWGEEDNPEWMNVYDTGINVASALGCFQRSDTLYGVQELSGNVFEWTASKVGAGSAARYVIKGGSFNTTSSLARTSFSYSYLPNISHETCSFRLMITID